MSDDHVLREFNPPQRVLKRAQYEAFRFSLVNGDVRVRNESHPNPGHHEYLVRIEDGVPSACDCPADEQYPSACKHRMAVAIRRPVVEAAMTMQELSVEPPSELSG